MRCKVTGGMVLGRVVHCLNDEQRSVWRTMGFPDT